MTSRIKVFYLCLFLALAAFSDPVRAVTLQYNLRLGVENVFLGNYDSGSRPSNFFQIDPQIGDWYYGTFSFDSEELNNPEFWVNGPQIAIELESFRLEIAGIVWDMNAPSEFAGFRYDADGNFSSDTTLFEFDGSQITQWFGGVFGFGDDPFVDGLYVAGPNRWNASDAVSFISGSLSTVPIPEPSTMLLLGAGLAALAGATRRKLKK